MSDSEYVRTDARLDVLASLETCADSLARTGESERAWKWVVLSLHSALQGAMVCHLSSGENIGALQDKNARDWRAWYADKSNGGETPPSRVASAPRLLARLRGAAHRFENDCGGILKITELQRKVFRRLHDLRNEFTHLPPQSWSIEIALIRESATGVLDIIEMIARDPHPFRRMSPSDQSALDSSIKEIGRMLAEA